MSTNKRNRTYAETKCWFCQVAFQASRQDAMFCSPRCRKAANRNQAKQHGWNHSCEDLVSQGLDPAIVAEYFGHTSSDQ